MFFWAVLGFVIILMWRGMSLKLDRDVGKIVRTGARCEGFPSIFFFKSSELNENVIKMSQCIHICNYVCAS